jgi:hypothetical protein
MLLRESPIQTQRAGLLGIWVARAGLAREVVLTDRRSRLPYLRANVARNTPAPPPPPPPRDAAAVAATSPAAAPDAAVRIRVEPLEWGSDAHPWEQPPRPAARGGGGGDDGGGGGGDGDGDDDESDSDDSYDTVLCCDLIFDRRLHAPLLTTLARLAPRVRRGVVLAFAHREPSEEVRRPSCVERDDVSYEDILS